MASPEAGLQPQRRHCFQIQDLPPFNIALVNVCVWSDQFPAFAVPFHSAKAPLETELLKTIELSGCLS